MHRMALRVQLLRLSKEACATGRVCPPAACRCPLQAALDEIDGKCQRKERTFRRPSFSERGRARSIARPKKKNVQWERYVLSNARHWLEYDSVTVAILLFGVGIVTLLALSI